MCLESPVNLSIKQKLLLISILPVLILGGVMTFFSIFQVNQQAEERLSSSREIMINDREKEVKALLEMAVSLVNDGPVTLMLDSGKAF